MRTIKAELRGVKKTDIQQVAGSAGTEMTMICFLVLSMPPSCGNMWAVDLDESIILEAYEAGEMIVFDEVALAADEGEIQKK